MIRLLSDWRFASIHIYRFSTNNTSPSCFSDKFWLQSSMIQFPKFYSYRWHRLLFIVVQALSRKTLIVLANDVRSFQFFFHWFDHIVCGTSTKYTKSFGNKNIRFTKSMFIIKLFRHAMKFFLYCCFDGNCSVSIAFYPINKQNVSVV